MKRDNKKDPSTGSTPKKGKLRGPLTELPNGACFDAPTRFLRPEAAYEAININSASKDETDPCARATNVDKA